MNKKTLATSCIRKLENRLKNLGLMPAAESIDQFSRRKKLFNARPPAPPRGRAAVCRGEKSGSRAGTGAVRRLARLTFSAANNLSSRLPPAPGQFFLCRASVAIFQKPAPVQAPAAVSVQAQKCSAAAVFGRRDA